MSLYGQDAEVLLLSTFLPRLSVKSVIDVGAERGAFAAEMRRAGSQSVHVIEPEQDNAEFLRQRFSDDPWVTIHQVAASSVDGELELHTSVSPDGTPVTFGHTVLDRPDTDQIAWHGTTKVEARSLGSMVETGEIPKHSGIVKIDTEGHDLAVVAGMGSLDADVVMVEHWTDLPHGLGPCPWTTEDMLAELRPRGFSHYVFVAHLGEFVILQWDEGDVPRGYMGNLVFLHDRVLEPLLFATLEVSTALARTAVEIGGVYVTAAQERMDVINEVARSLLGRWLLHGIPTPPPDAASRDQRP